MQTQEKCLGRDLIIAASIIALGLVTAATILVSRPSTPLTTSSAKAQFESQMKQILGRAPYYIDGERRVLSYVSAGPVGFSVDREWMIIEYTLAWMPQRNINPMMEKPLVCRLKNTHVGSYRTESATLNVGGVVKNIDILIK